MIFLGVTIFGTIGGWIGASWFDHGNWFGAVSLILSVVGSFFGVWVGFKAGKWVEP